MWSGATLLLLCGVWTVNAEVHSLHYIYTAFTRPVDLPGIHEFSAMGLLDGRPIDYYDSTTKVKVPKEDWMRQRLGQDYWDKGTSSRQTKQQWFKVNLEILTTRLGRNNTENHVLQWRHGCERDTAGAVRGVDQYSYDGEDFLSFDSDHRQWVAPMPAAVATKRKWDGIQQLNDYTEGYLHKECIQWLDNFLVYRKEANIQAVAPNVYIHARQVKKNRVLSCFATGFRPREIDVKIKRDGHLVERADGLQSTGVRPNGDGTHQIKMWVLIPGSDTAKYTCEVHHPASEIHVVKEWDHQVESEKLSIGLIAGGAIGAVVGVLIIVTVVMIVLKRMRTPVEREVTILPVWSEEKAPLTVDNELKAPGRPDEEKTLLRGPGSVTSSDSGTGFTTGSTTGSDSGSGSQKSLAPAV